MIRFAILSLEIDREKLEPAALRRYHTSSARWVLIQRFLDAKGSDYDRVLMADAGQTFFQGNPFDIIGDPGQKTNHSVSSHKSPSLCETVHLQRSGLNRE